MPWTTSTAKVMILAQELGLITDREYEGIRAFLSGEQVAAESYGEAAALFKSGSGFKFSKSSEKELLGVKPELVKVVRRALEVSTQDFTVFDGIRTLAEQQKHVANGTSKTLKSKHLDGLAVDLVPWSNGKPVWDWKLIWPIAEAMDYAATELGFAGNIRWGGAWDRTLADFGGDARAYQLESELYAKRHPGKDFLDGPHFEWVD